MTRRVKLGIVAAGIVALSLVAACDKEEPGTPEVPTTPAPPASVPSSAPPNAAPQAPRVQEPLDASVFVDDPCASLTDAQREDFALENGQADTDDAIPGESCMFPNHDAQISVHVTYQPELTGGLSHLYAQHAGGQYDVWEPTDVGGHPAIHYGETSLENEGDCDIAVGVSDSLFFRATVRGNAGDDSCTGARNVASAVLETIKAGGG